MLKACRILEFTDSKTWMRVLPLPERVSAGTYDCFSPRPHVDVTIREGALYQYSLSCVIHTPRDLQEGIRQEIPGISLVLTTGVSLIIMFRRPHHQAYHLNLLTQ